MISNEDIVEIRLDASKFLSWKTFHSYFQRKFGFPDFYGKNINAWIDCMGDLDKPEYGMVKNISIRKGQCVVFKINNIDDLKSQAHDIYMVIIECSASINSERMRNGELPLIFLSF
jgi:RNAse (barnase) inhibitor barstar